MCQFRSATVLLCLLLGSLLCTCGPAPESAQGHLEESEKRPPNILWLSVEDLSPNIGVYGHPLARTPNIDALAGKGTLYKRAYSNGVQCSPARSTLISGMYAPMLGTDMHREARAVPSEFYFPRLLRQAGYFTTNNAKRDYNDSDIPTDVWDISKNKAHYNKRPNPGQPFFAVFNLGTTHMSRLTKTPIGKRAGRITDPAKVSVPPYITDLPEVRDDIAWHLDAVAEMDTWVGEQLAELEASGQADSTIVFFFSDHGGCIPRGKAYTYETGGRVPLIVYVPPAYRELAYPDGQPETTGRLVAFADFGPTLLNLIGVPAPPAMVGRPFLGPESNAASNIAEDVFLFRANQAETYAPSRALVEERYKIIANYQSAYPDGTPQAFQWQMPGQRAWQKSWMTGGGNERSNRFWRLNPPYELYDVQADPNEVNNLIDVLEFTQVADRMKAKLSAHLREINDLGFLPPGMREPQNPQPLYERVRGTDRDIGAIIAAAELAMDADPESASQLIGFLSAADPAIRYWGASGLAGLARRSGGVVPGADLIEYIAKETAPEVRALLAEAAVYAGHSPGYDALLAELINDNTAAFASLQNLGKIAAPLNAKLITIYPQVKPALRFHLRSALINTGRLPYENLLREEPDFTR
ncbi:sulfatase-like hydrolase/transferase [Neolewinella aurantiaca]|uniref:Sulfatase-like hydrolase/transferase n=1 Tax=Neolewinella aurantiaca TaxID=2602767 RepID=A0A5C7FQ11_9BACT|nr:sulfatase-like hydrolase/transferase [Neolewinella aurantiaca]TXF88047.1 sulfatase-like hydrolase/transferase [Neolewinella aurantiaca]